MDDKKPKCALSRRDFFAATGAAAAAAGVATLGSAAVGANGTSKPKKQSAMVIDTRRCYGCQACAVACKAEFKVPLGETRSWVEEIEKGTYPHVSRTLAYPVDSHTHQI